MTDLLKAILEILKLLQDPLHFIFVLTVLILFIIIWWQQKIIIRQGDFCIKLSNELKDLSTANTELTTLLRILVNRV